MMNTHIHPIGSYRTAANLCASILALLIAVAAPAQAETVFTTAEDVLSQIPPSFNDKPTGEWNAAVVDQANQFFASVKDQPARFSIPVEKLEKFGQGFRIKVPDRTASGPRPYKVRLWVYFDADKAQTLAGVSKGSTIEVTGKITEVFVRVQGDGFPWLNMNIRKADVPGSAGSQTSNVPAPSSGTTFSGATPSRIHSIDEILAAGDISKPFKPFDTYDHKAINAFTKAIEVFKGREIELEFAPEGLPVRREETLFEWKLVDVKAGPQVFEPHLFLRVTPDQVGRAGELTPGKTGKVRGIIKTCSATQMAKQTLYLGVQASELSVGGKGAGNSSTAAALQLSRTWDTPLQGGSATMDDLAKLFGSVAQPNVDLAPSNGTTLYNTISYLMPAKQAIESLKLPVRLPSKVLIACPGLPRDSFYYYAVDGNFEGYNRMYLVVDRADQVLSVELVDESPRKAEVYIQDWGWHTYDFINTRTKALNTLRIDHKLSLQAASTWDEPHSSRNFMPDMSAKNAAWRVAKLDSVLSQKDTRPHSFGWVTKQVTRWYVPRQVVELMLVCVKKAGR